MAEWVVLGLSGDPVPGDPVGVRSMAARLGGYSDLARSNTDRLRGIVSDVSGGPLQARGDYAGKYAEQVGELPDLLGKLGTAYQRCSEALTRYAGSLEEAVGRSRAALRRGGEAFDRFSGARRQADALMPVDKVLPWRSGPVGVAGLCAAITPAQADLATTGMDEATRAQVRQAVMRAQSAAADQQTARRLADDAAELRDGAADRCAQEIDAALDGSGIKNTAWYEKAWDTVSAPFRSWDAFVGFCGKVAMVAGVIALFVSGPLGWALMAAALVAGAMLLADSLNKYARGQAGMLDVGLAVLGVIPGGRGVVSVSKLASAARGMGAALLRGGSKLMGHGAFGLRTAVPYGLKFAGGLRGALRNPAQFGRGMVCRAFKGDPVDVATGELLIDVTDWSLPGSLPLGFRRIHTSAASVGHSLGGVWVTSLDHRVEVDDAGVAYTGDDGTIVVFPHPADGQPVEPSEGARLRLRSVPDTTGGGYTITDPLTGISEHFAHAGGLAGVTALPLVATTDRAGRRIDYTFDGDGYLTGIEHSGGYRIRVDRTSEGPVSGFTLLARPGTNEADTTLVRYGYDVAGRLSEVVNSSGQAMRYSYDNAGRLVRWEDRNGTWYVYEYDSEGRVVRADGTDAILRAQFAYHPAPAAANGGGDATGASRTVFTESLGHTWTYETNAGGQVTAIVDPTGARTTQSWGRYNWLLSSTDPLGRNTSHVYNEVGNRTSTTLPDGAQVATRYDEVTHQPVQVRLPDDTVWRADYDPAGLLLSRTDPAGAVTRYAYDDRGHLTTIVDALDHATRVDCDAAGLPVGVVDPLGAITRIVRDGFGRPTQVVDPLDAVTRLVWTTEGLLASRTDSDGAVWAWTYDGEDNLRTATDPVGQTITYAPTPFDQIATMETPDGGLTRYGYDTERRLTSVVNPAGLTWTYTRDPRGLVVAETDFNGAITRYDRDAAGQLTRRTNAAGQSIAYTHDPRGQVIAEHTSDGAMTRYEFDSLGWLVHAVNLDTDLAFTRDQLGRVTAETVNDRILSSAYDSLGRRVLRRTPVGAVTVTDYDAAGNPTTFGTGLTGGPVLSLDHDPASNLAELRLGDATLQQAFDPVGRLAAQTLTTTGGDSEAPAVAQAATPGSSGQLLLRRDFGYSIDGLLTDIDDLTGGVHRYTHDPQGRVTTAATPHGEESYEYDASSNLTHAAWSAAGAGSGVAGDVQGPRTHAGTLVTRAGAATYSYDGAGRLVGQRRRSLSGKTLDWAYTWDAHDRLTQVTTPNGTTWAYAYDPLGRRIAKQRLGADPADAATPPNGIGLAEAAAGPAAPAVEQTWFTWDGVTLAETHHTPTGATLTWDYRPGTFTPLTQRTHTPPPSGPGCPGHDGGGDRDGDGHDQSWYDEQFHAIVTDLVGTPTHLFDADGRLRSQPAATVWGTPLVADTTTAASGAGTAIPLRFPGQYHDPETGLHYNYFRHYDPVTAAFTTPDPLGLLGGPNPHTYVPNPLEWLDPLGLTYLEGSGAAKPSAKVINLPEVTYPSSVKPGDAMARWDSFLGSGLTTNIHPRLGSSDPNRIVSADGMRSIRMGPHEMGSPPTKFHYHEETWLFDAQANTWTVSNLKVNVPFPKGAW